MRVPAPGQAQKIAMMGALDFVYRQLTVVTSQTKSSADFHRPARTARSNPWPQAGSGEQTRHHRPGQWTHPRQPSAALAERKHWLTPEWMAKYAPELNDIERDWKTFKAYHLAHKTFQSRDDLKIAIVAGIKAIDTTRKSHPLANRRIFA